MTPGNKALGHQSHPTEEELIDYRSVGLDAERRKTVQGHLSECDLCREVIKDIDDFFEPARETEKSVGADKIGREWESLLLRIRAEEKLTASILTGKRFSPPTLRLRPIYAVAAVLTCVALSLGLYALLLQRENRRLSREMQSEREAGAERLRVLEVENQHLREETGGQKNDNDKLRRQQEDYEARLSELRQPKVNSPIFDIYSRQFIRRSPGKYEVNRIKIPAYADSFILIVNGEDQPQAPSYEVEILTDKGRSVWRRRGLRREDDGNFVIMIPRTFLSSGEYRLKIRSRDGNRSNGVVEYLISIAI
jgi:hypothetical protein